MSETTQDIAAIETYFDNWATHLNNLPSSGITISSASVTASGGATVASAAPGTDKNGNIGVVFKLTTSGCTSSTDITVTVSPTLSNGDTPVRHHVIGITND